MKQLFSILILAYTLSAPAYGSCFPSLTLGGYVLGGWQGPGWEVSGTVGDISTFVNSRAELRQQRNKYVAQCETKGRQLISDATAHLTAERDDIAATFDRTCTDPVVCPEIREITIQRQQAAIDDEIDRMTTWYTNNIRACKRTFRAAFRQLAPQICS